MNQRQRHAAIEAVLAGHAHVTVEMLARDLEVSPATIRRDMSAMARAGRIHRVRGGAEPLALPGGAVPTGFDRRRLEQAARKRAIAARAAELCAPGSSLIVNGGTTTFELAGFIKDRGLQILTNCLAFAQVLTAAGNCRVLLPGGQIFPDQSLVLSPYAQDTIIEHFYAPLMFVGAFAVRPQGLIENDPLLIRAEQKLFEHAEQVVALVDGSKFQARGSLITCPLQRLARVVTDDGAPQEGIAMLEDAGVVVDVVSGFAATAHLPLSDQQEVFHVG